jgi:hypothetical protein
MLSRSGLWLTKRQNREGAYRYDFQPSTHPSLSPCRRHESFPTKYAVKHYPTDPMRLPTAWLTARVLRHTRITALHDAGCVREQIRAITGQTIASINEVLDRYTK